MSVVGAYCDPRVASAVQRVGGVSAQVTALEIDHVPPGLADAMFKLGIKLPTAGV